MSPMSQNGKKKKILKEVRAKEKSVLRGISWWASGPGVSQFTYEIQQLLPFHIQYSQLPFSPTFPSFTTGYLLPYLFQVLTILAQCQPFLKKSTAIKPRTFLQTHRFSPPLPVMETLFSPTARSLCPMPSI